MNDKNFIEELRQKREEYGVTQTRLAVACGISREYYNRIEKGKQPLNDELKGVIEKQIERFNPQEPLFLLIDYFFSSPRVRELAEQMTASRRGEIPQSPKELIDAAMRRMPKVTAQSATWHDADEGSEENGKESLTL